MYLPIVGNLLSPLAKSMKGSRFRDMSLLGCGAVTPGFCRSLQWKVQMAQFVGAAGAEAKIRRNPTARALIEISTHRLSTAHPSDPRLYFKYFQ